MTRLFWTAVLIGLCSAASAAEQSFPTRPISMIVPYAAGGSADVVGRRIAVTGCGRQAPAGTMVPGQVRAAAKSTLRAAPADYYKPVTGQTGQALLSTLKDAKESPVRARQAGPIRGRHDLGCVDRHRPR